MTVEATSLATYKVDTHGWLQSYIASSLAKTHYELVTNGFAVHEQLRCHALAGTERVFLCSCSVRAIAHVSSLNQAVPYTLT